MRLDPPGPFCETRADLKTPTDTHIHPISPWKRALVWPLGALVRLWTATLRFEVPTEDLRIIRVVTEPTVFILWHNRLFLAAEIFRRYRQGHRIYTLISASRDGSWLAAFFASVGLGAVRGSSSRNGREAATELIKALREGHDAGITPDGPRGPAYEMKPGALIVARRSGKRVVLVGADFESSARLRSWDGFHLPLPFSRVGLKFVEVGQDALGDRDQAAAAIGRQLIEINPDRRPAPLRTRA